METELKLTVRPAIAGGPLRFFQRVLALRELAGKPLGLTRRVDIQDRYFDTVDARLARVGGGLRLRLENGIGLVTLKISQGATGAVARRQEWEEPLTQESLTRTLSHVAGALGPGPFPFQDFLEGRRCGPLIPILKVDTVRLARSVGAAALLSLDRVSYPDLAAEPFFDIEVELVGESDPAQLLTRIERELIREAGGQLDPSGMSKLERGVLLRSRHRPPPESK